MEITVTIKKDGEAQGTKHKLEASGTSKRFNRYHLDNGSVIATVYVPKAEALASA